MLDRENTSLRADLDRAAEFIKTLDQTFWCACLRRACLKGSRSDTNGFLPSSHTVSSPQLHLRPHLYLKSMKACDTKKRVCLCLGAALSSQTFAAFFKKSGHTNDKTKQRWSFGLTFILIFIKFMVQKRYMGVLTRIIGVFVVLWHYLEQFYQEGWTPNCIADSFQEQLFVLRP